MAKCVKCGERVRKVDGSGLCEDCAAIAELDRQIYDIDRQLGRAAPDEPPDPAKKGCPHCGERIYRAAVFCPSCGCQVGKIRMGNTSGQLFVKVSMVFSCIVLGIFIIPLLWTVPMTVSVFRRFEDRDFIGAGFKVCVFFFVSILAGLVLFCMDTSGK